MHSSTNQRVSLFPESPKSLNGGRKSSGRYPLRLRMSTRKTQSLLEIGQAQYCGDLLTGYRGLPGR